MTKVVKPISVTKMKIRFNKYIYNVLYLIYILKFYIILKQRFPFLIYFANKCEICMFYFYRFSYFPMRNNNLFINLIPGYSKKVFYKSIHMWVNSIYSFLGLIIENIDWKYRKWKFTFETAMYHVIGCDNAKRIYISKERTNPKSYFHTKNLISDSDENVQIIRL